MIRTCADLAVYPQKVDDTLDYVVDLQGFKADGHFVHKELAIAPLRALECAPAVFLFKPPFHWETLSSERKRENSWIERRLTGIHWASGNVDYYDITKILNDTLINARRIYVKGFEKKKWLEERLSMSSSVKVIDMDVLGCPGLKNFAKKGNCENHPLLPEGRCAMKNVNVMRFWLQTYSDIFGEDVCY